MSRTGICMTDQGNRKTKTGTVTRLLQISSLIGLGLLVQAQFIAAGAEQEFKPRLGKAKHYNEYWEQQFLFDDDTLVTSQFLITNLPISKQHGIMLASVKPPAVPSLIIKNGRKRSGWSVGADAPSISIFQHSLSGSDREYSMELKNTTAELSLAFKAPARKIVLTGPNNKLGLPEVTLYAPTATGKGRWRTGPEHTGRDTYSPWQNISEARGYGLHVVQDSKPDQSLKRWQRFTSITSPSGNNYQPILHSFETQKGASETILVLTAPVGEPIRFEKVTIVPNQDASGWTILADNGVHRIEGSVENIKKLEQFNMASHLNGLEKLVAGSMAKIKRSRQVAAYNFSLQASGNETIISGQALAEDISFGKPLKKKRRRPRR